MKKTQESKLKMSRTVSEILGENETIVSKTPGLPDALTTLNTLIEEAGLHSQGQLNNGKELTTVKNKAKAELITGTLTICAALAAYGTTSSDPALAVLKTKYTFSDSEVRRLRDIPLLAFSNTVFDDAQPYAAQLEPFATAEDVTQLKALTEKFNASLPKKRTQQTKSKLSTQNLEDVITQIDQLLNTTIDVLVKPWEYKEPDFFKAYQNARIIVDAASRRTKPEEPVSVTQPD